jgi:hypothetical protein
MGYIDATTLSRFMPQRLELTATSIPDIDTTDLICDAISAELDAAALRGGWAVPIASGATGAFNVMRLYAQYGAGWHVLEQRLGDGNTAVSRAVEYRDAYLRAIAALEQGTMQLPGADHAGSDERVLPLSNSGNGQTCCATGAMRFARTVTRCTEF